MPINPLEVHVRSAGATNGLTDGAAVLGVGDSLVGVGLGVGLAVVAAGG